jgi:hypothetical protein
MQMAMIVKEDANEAEEPNKGKARAKWGQSKGNEVKTTDQIGLSRDDQKSSLQSASDAASDDKSALRMKRSK